MTSESTDRVELLQGTLDLIVLRALDTMGPQHAYGLAARLEQVAEPSLRLDQGSLAANRNEPRGQVLQRDQSRRARPRKADRALAAACRPGGQALVERGLTWHL